MAARPYEYLPLEGQSWIRILQLQPAHSYSEPLKCGIIHVDRRRVSRLRDGNIFHYSAVSYVWGNERIFTSQLTIQKSQKHAETMISHLAITTAVEVMLRRFRSKSKTINLWLDAVCLNQGDPLEIGQQIPLMADIFRQARNVSIWMGPENDGVVELFQFFRDHKQKGIRWTDPKVANDAQITRWPLKQLRNFLHRPWFTRRWVLQELILAKEADVYAFNQEISYSELWDIFREISYLCKLYENNEDEDRPFGLDEHSKRVLQVFHDFRQTRHTLLHNLWLYHDLECLDPRDRIFAIIGFSTDDIRWSEDGAHIGSWSLDYQKGYKELYKGIAAFLITHGDLALVVQHVLAFGSLGDSYPEEPSWCPDWSSRRNAQIPDTWAGPSQGLWSPSSLIQGESGLHAEFLCFDQDKKKLFTRQSGARIISIIPPCNPGLDNVARHKWLEQTIVRQLEEMPVPIRTSTRFMAHALCELVLCHRPKVILASRTERNAAEVQLKLEICEYLTKLCDAEAPNKQSTILQLFFAQLLQLVEKQRLFLVRAVEVFEEMVERPRNRRGIQYGIGLSVKDIAVGDLILTGSQQLGGSRNPARANVLTRPLLRRISIAGQADIGAHLSKARTTKAHKRRSKQRSATNHHHQPASMSADGADDLDFFQAFGERDSRESIEAKESSQTTPVATVPFDISKITWAAIAAPRVQNDEKRSKQTHETSLAIDLPGPELAIHEARDQDGAAPRSAIKTVRKLNGDMPSWASIVAGSRPSPSSPANMIDIHSGLDDMDDDGISDIMLNTEVVQTRSWASVVASPPTSGPKLGKREQLLRSIDNTLTGEGKLTELQRRDLSVLLRNKRSRSDVSARKLVDDFIDEYRKYLTRKKKHAATKSELSSRLDTNADSSGSVSSDAVITKARTVRDKPVARTSLEHETRRTAPTAIRAAASTKEQADIRPSKEQEREMAEQGWYWQKQEAVACRLAGVVDLVMFSTALLSSPFQGHSSLHLKPSDRTFYDIVIF